MHESLRSDQPDAWRVCRRVAQRQVQRPAEDRADATGMDVAIFRLAVDVAAGRVATHRMRSFGQGFDCVIAATDGCLVDHLPTISSSRGRGARESASRCLRIRPFPAYRPGVFRRLILDAYNDVGRLNDRRRLPADLQSQFFRTLIRDRRSDRQRGRDFDRDMSGCGAGLTRSLIPLRSPARAIRRTLGRYSTSSRAAMDWRFSAASASRRSR